jgi:hypothetical protein
MFLVQECDSKDSIDDILSRVPRVGLSFDRELSRHSEIVFAG